MLGYEKCGVPNFDNQWRINNQPRCDRHWDQLSLKPSPSQNKISSHIGGTVKDIPTCQGEEETENEFLGALGLMS